MSKQEDDLCGALDLLGIVLVIVLTPFVIAKWTSNSNPQYRLVDTKTNSILAADAKLKHCLWRKNNLIKTNSYYAANQNVLICRHVGG